jgi:hypothetical protein
VVYVYVSGAVVCCGVLWCGVCGRRAWGAGSAGVREQLRRAAVGVAPGGERNVPRTCRQTRAGVPLRLLWPHGELELELE